MYCITKLSLLANSLFKCITVRTICLFFLSIDFITFIWQGECFYSIVQCENTSLKFNYVFAFLFTLKNTLAILEIYIHVCVFFFSFSLDMSTDAVIVTFSAK
jgi:hypothetical protein